MEPSHYVLDVLRKDAEFILYRGEHSKQPSSPSVLLLAPAAMQPALETLRTLEHEYSLRDEVDSAWAVRPMALSEQRGRTTLVLEDPGGETLDRFLPGPMEMMRFLRIAIGLANAIGQLHQPGSSFTKTSNPPMFWWNSATGEVWLTGFGIASRLPRERQSPEPPEFIAGTLSLHGAGADGTHESLDRFAERPLLSLGVTLYEMLTGSLPFHGFGSDGVGGLPYCKTADAAQRAIATHPGRCSGHRHEAACQNGGGAISAGRAAARRATCGAVSLSGKRSVRSMNFR